MKFVCFTKCNLINFYLLNQFDHNTKYIYIISFFKRTSRNREFILSLDFGAMIHLSATVRFIAYFCNKDTHYGQVTYDKTP